MFSFTRLCRHIVLISCSPYSYRLVNTNLYLIFATNFWWEAVGFSQSSLFFLPLYFHAEKFGAVRHGHPLSLSPTFFFLIFLAFYRTSSHVETVLGDWRSWITGERQQESLSEEIPGWHKAEQSYVLPQPLRTWTALRKALSAGEQTLQTQIDNPSLKLL